MIDPHPMHNQLPVRRATNDVLLVPERTPASKLLKLVWTTLSWMTVLCSDVGVQPSVPIMTERYGRIGLS